MQNLEQELFIKLKEICCVETVKKFLDQGVDIRSIDDEGNGLLHYAVENSLEYYPHIVALLIEHGADILHQNAKGETPLFMASALGYNIVAQLLLKENISVATIENNFNKKPIDVVQNDELRNLLSTAENILNNNSLSNSYNEILLASYSEVQTELTALLSTKDAPTFEVPTEESGAEALYLVGVVTFS